MFAKRLHSSTVTFLSFFACSSSNCTRIWRLLLRSSVLGSTPFGRERRGDLSYCGVLGRAAIQEIAPPYLLPLTPKLTRSPTCSQPRLPAAQSNTAAPASSGLERCVPKPRSDVAYAFCSTKEKGIRRPRTPAPLRAASGRNQTNEEGHEAPHEKALEGRCFELLTNWSLPSRIERGSTSEDLARKTASVQAVINTKLHRIGVDEQVLNLFETQSGKFRGSTDPTMSAEQRTRHREEVIRAARTADSSVAGLEARTAWWWVTVHAIPVALYVGQGSHGTDSLRAELEADNGGVRILSTIQWLSGAVSVKARYNDKIITALSVVFAVSDESTYRLTRRGGLRLQGRRCDTEDYEEVRSDVGCGSCCGWGHIESKCDRHSA